MGDFARDSNFWVGLVTFICVGLAPVFVHAQDDIIIRNIRIEVREVFEGGELSWFYRTANSLKINTRKEIIKRELLFKPGDILNNFALEESARLLRSLHFIRNITIYPILDGNQADIVVSVQDTWTLFPQVGLTAGSGARKTSAGVIEKNLLGVGKRLELLYLDDEGRETIQAVYDDPRILNTDYRLLAARFERSDGYRSVGSFGLPFRSLVQPYAWVVNVESQDLVERLFEAGDERFIFRNRSDQIGGGLTMSTGEPESNIRRYTLGYDYSQDKFFEATDKDFRDIDVDPANVSRSPDLLAENRKFSGPFFSFRQIEPEFISLSYIDYFERVQDFNLGRELAAKLGYAAKKLGSFDDTYFISASASRGWRLDLTSFVRGSLSSSSRLAHDRFSNNLFQLELKYYDLLGSKYLRSVYLGRHTIAGSFVMQHTEGLDKDRELLLGSRTGLRGYTDRTFSGDSLFLANLEDRFHLVDDVYQLFSLGGAVFVDVGGVSSRGPGEIFRDNVFADVGVGLRIGFPRASGGSVLRVDLALPLRSGPDGTDRFEPRVMITTGQAFSSSLSTEAPEAKQASVDLGF